MKKYKRIVLS